MARVINYPHTATTEGLLNDILTQFRSRFELRASDSQACRILALSLTVPVERLQPDRIIFGQRHRAFPTHGDRITWAKESGANEERETGMNVGNLHRSVSGAFDANRLSR